VVRTSRLRFAAQNARHAAIFARMI
jgi:hypothetical protein